MPLGKCAAVNIKQTTSKHNTTMKNQKLIGDLNVQPNGEFSFQYVATRKGVGKRIWCKVTIYRTGNLWNVWAKGYEDALPCLHCKVKKSETLQGIFEAIDARI